jgi:hypothetical protein
MRVRGLQTFVTPCCPLAWIIIQGWTASPSVLSRDRRRLASWTCFRAELFRTNKNRLALESCMQEIFCDAIAHKPSCTRHSLLDCALCLRKDGSVRSSAVTRSLTLETIGVERSWHLTAFVLILATVAPHHASRAELCPSERTSLRAMPYWRFRSAAHPLEHPSSGSNQRASLARRNKSIFPFVMVSSHPLVCGMSGLKRPIHEGRLHVRRLRNDRHKRVDSS